MNLNEIDYFSDPIDQWAAEREFEMRREAYAAHVIAQTLRRGIEAMRAIASGFRVAGEAMRRARENALVLDGIPIEMQREVLAITADNLGDDDAAG